MNRFAHDFLNDPRGNVLMIVGLVFFTLVGIMGAGVDLGRQQLIRIKLQQSADAAVLAGSLAPDSADRAAVALRYFNLNYPEKYLGVDRPTPVITVTSSNITVQAQADMRTYFARFLDRPTLTSRANTKTQIITTKQYYDVILVMDNSGSMSETDVGPPTANMPNSFLGAARNAALEACTNFYTVYYGNALTARTACTLYWGDAPSSGRIYNYGMKDATRLNALRSSALFISEQLLGKDVNKGSGTNVNRMATVSWSNVLYGSQALTSNQTQINNEINSMFAFGPTNSHLGLSRANTLSTNFISNHVKVVILLTDGMDTFADTNFRQDFTSPTFVRDGRGCNGLDYCTVTSGLSLPICSSFKSKGVLVYTIAYGRDVNTGSEAANAQAFLSSCATGKSGSNKDQYFFTAPDAKTLQGVFQQIVESIKKVRIVE